MSRSGERRRTRERRLVWLGLAFVTGMLACIGFDHLGQTFAAGSSVAGSERQAADQPADVAARPLAASLEAFARQI